jgi:hypothetical protein
MRQFTARPALAPRAGRIHKHLEFSASLREAVFPSPVLARDLVRDNTGLLQGPKPLREHGGSYQRDAAAKVVKMPSA